jgi:hypothetical protein
MTNPIESLDFSDLIPPKRSLLARIWAALVAAWQRAAWRQ